jgi:hypothetical protein
MANQEDSFTVSVVSNGIGTAAGTIQGLIAEAYKKNPSIAAGLALAKVTVVAVAADTLTVAIAVQSGDPDRIGKASAAAIGSIALSTIAAIAAGAVTATGLWPAITIAGGIGALGYIGGKLGGAWWDAYKYGALPANNPWTDADPFQGMPGHGISPTVNTATTGALTWEPTPPRGADPLVLDLDGGGISNSGIEPGYPILFDHDGDGVRNATGWVGAGEAIVVRDLDGNGTIDSGREIFGDNTLLTRGPKAGQRAADGFEAMADLDSNNDGQFNAADAAFASVKLWKDANQNGISEAGELFTFAQMGVQGNVEPQLPSWFAGAARRALRQTTMEHSC